jgi:hypothetical protein
VKSFLRFWVCEKNFEKKFFKEEFEDGLKARVGNFLQKIIF